MRTSVRFGVVLIVAGIALACGSRGPELVPEVVVVHRDAVPADPADPSWGKVPVHRAALVLQDLVEPRLLVPSTPEVRVQAVTDGTRVAFRLEWDDAAGDDAPGPAKMVDACAVQLPVSSGPDLPAPQMGEAGRAVEIALWRASWQAVVDGRPDTIRSLYPNAAVQHYPFEAAALPEGSEARREAEARYAPARALGNPMAGPRKAPVEDLVAEGPGTIRPAGTSSSQGAGKRTAKGWSVVLSRPVPVGLVPGGRTQVAFAVWQGDRLEAGARKMRSPWIPLSWEKRS